MNAVVTINKLKMDEEYFINSIIESNGANLPATIGEILPVLAFTKGKAAAFKSLVSSTKNIEAQKEIHQSALESGQRYAQAALYSEAKLGDMLSVTTKTSIERLRDKEVSISPSRGMVTRDGVDQTPTLKDMGVTRDQSYESQIIAKASKDGTLEEVIKKAEETGNMATKSAVITAMKKKQWEKLTEENKKNKVNEMPPDINQELYKISEALVSLCGRTRRMEPYVDQLNPAYVRSVILYCNKIIDTLEGTVCEEK
jgi:ribosomal protein L12E/L44/L45/RPP1/RPP2